MSEPKPESAPDEKDGSLGRFLMYTASLPERVVRSTVGVAAGAAREAAQVLIPQAFQSSKTYEVVVVNSLRFLTEDVGGVKRTEDVAAPSPDQYLARKAVGNFVDLAGLATLHLSPLWMFAIVSDVAYGSKSYLRELTAELRRQGLIGDDSAIERVDDLLKAVQMASAETASLFDTPPLSIDELKTSLARTRDAIAAADYRAILPESELAAYWNEMRRISAREGVSLLGVSGALTMHMLGKVGTVTKGALTGAQVAGGLVNRHIVGHYAEALHRAQQLGFYTLVRESSGPYVQAVWRNFAPDQGTWTSTILSGRAFRRVWESVSLRFRGRRLAVHSSESILETNEDARVESRNDASNVTEDPR